MQAGDTVGESDATYHDQAGERSETCEAKGSGIMRHVCIANQRHDSMDSSALTFAIPP